MRCRSFSAPPFHCEHRLQSKSIWRNRGFTCCKMGGSLSLRQFRAVVMGISRRRVPSKSWKRNEHIIRVCTARSSILVETRSLPTQMQTCRSRPEENLFRRQCITSCGSPAPMECMPDIYRGIQHRTAVSGCRNSTRLRFSIQSALALRSRCTEGRQPGVTSVSYDRHFEGARIDLETRASIQDLLRRRHLGGGDKSQTFCCAPSASSRHGCHYRTEKGEERKVVLRPLFGRGLINAIRTGRLWPTREIDKVSQDV